MKTKSIDNLVTGTVNAPWKRSLSAPVLAAMITDVDVEEWLPHLATFFTEVRPHLVLGFAQNHAIPSDALLKSYSRVKALTGEANGVLEGELAKLAKAA
ncbi:hypothetical protein [Azospirillum sp. SYSU D00513]|uniref:hypothetical protein n=1 Tax=Azospirillum sp. SYSU D00513 TaxID=2812561 RepID=UPI001A96A02F|nr:hypothetical protein [Azospirillum sp. SYSU D00513]